MAISASETLSQLAKLKDPTKRNQLALGVTELCITEELSESAQPVAGDLLIMLSDVIQIEAKKIMATKLAKWKWAPTGAIRHLAFSEIEVASIIIAKSHRFTEKDMLELAKLGSMDHRRHLAKRSNLCVSVSNQVAMPGEASVLRALANNDTAEISEKTLDICLTASKELPKLREALARRHDISTEYATQLCIMLPEVWREEMYRRFGLDKDKVEKLTIEAALNKSNKQTDADAEQAVLLAEEEGKLSGKYALAAMKANNQPVFDYAVAKLCKLTVTQWRTALAMGGARAAAMATQAMDLDKTSYPLIHRGLQKSGRMHQALEGDAMATAANVFRMYGAEKASKVLRQLGSRV